MPTTSRPPAVPSPPGSWRPGPLLLAGAVLLVVCAVTLGPADVVAESRRTVVAAPWLGAVHRSTVEAAANVLLFVPVGGLAALVLRRRGPLLPLAVGASASVLVELVQTALPGRVPDPADVVTNTLGTAVGVALATAHLVSARRRRRRRRPVGA